MSKVKVSIEGHYEVEEMSYGKYYVWQPSHAMIECDCGQVMDADEHHTTCRTAEPSTRTSCGRW